MLVNRYSPVKSTILLSRYTFIDRMKEIFSQFRMFFILLHISMKFSKESFIDREYIRNIYSRKITLILHSRKLINWLILKIATHSWFIIKYWFLLIYIYIFNSRIYHKDYHETWLIFKIINLVSKIFIDIIFLLSIIFQRIIVTNFIIYIIRLVCRKVSLVIILKLDVHTHCEY